MQITSKFTTAVHILVCIDVFDGQMRVTSDFLSGSTGINPVIIRNVLAQLKTAGIVSTRKGSGGAHLAKPLSEVTLYDICKATDAIDGTGLFHFHENPNAACPVGRNIHKAMDKKLASVQEAMENELKKTTIAEIAERTREAIRSERIYTGRLCLILSYFYTGVLSSKMKNCFF